MSHRICGAVVATPLSGSIITCRGSLRFARRRGSSCRRRPTRIWVRARRWRRRSAAGAVRTAAAGTRRCRRPYARRAAIRGGCPAGSQSRRPIRCSGLIAGGRGNSVPLWFTPPYYVRPTVLDHITGQGGLQGNGVGVRLKVGDKYWEEWRGGVWGGAAVPSLLGVWGLAPEKKINFVLKKLCNSEHMVLLSYITA